MKVNFVWWKGDDSCMCPWTHALSFANQWISQVSTVYTKPVNIHNLHALIGFSSSGCPVIFTGLQNKMDTCASVITLPAEV